MHPAWTPERPYTVPRSNFDTLWQNALPTVIQILTGEDWNVVMYVLGYAYVHVFICFFVCLYLYLEVCIYILFITCK